MSLGQRRKSSKYKGFRHNRLATGLLCALLCGSATAGLHDAYEITLPSQSLKETLVKLGEIAKISIIFSDRTVTKLDSTAISGNMTIEQALQLAIEGSDLELQVISPRAVAIVSAKTEHVVSESTPDSNEELFYIEELMVSGRKVTGSRLRQADLNGFAPVEILSGTELRMSGAESLSDLLKYIPVTSGNSTSTAVSNGGDGTATVTLRGLPASNTLVLLNGQRIASNGFGGKSVDINTIPTAAIERIEILKDGASAIYGSDAIAGVVNIILHKQFDGLQLETYYGQSGHGDNGTITTNAVWGRQGSKGSYMIALNHYEQDGFNSRDRELSRDADSRPLGGIDKRSTATPSARITIDETTMIVKEGTSGDSSSDFREATDEDLFDFLDYTSSLTPSQRTNLFINGEYEISERIIGSLSASYTHTKSKITFAPTPIFTAFEDTPIMVAADNPYNPFDTEIGDVRRRMLEVGERAKFNKNRAARISLGLRGHLEDWEWATTANWSRTSANEEFTGLINADRLRQGLGSPDQCSEDCVAINLFGPTGSLDQEQVGWIKTGSTSTGETELRNLTVDLNTWLWDLPAGEVGLAFGGEMRHESMNITPDQLATQNNLIGGHNFTSSSGTRNVFEAYMEWMVPLLSEKPWVKDLDFSLALRHSHFSDFGNSTNPKASLRYQSNEDWTFRATYATGFRAPSLIELYKGASENQSRLSDPCSKPENVGVLPGCQQQTDPLRMQYLTQLGGNATLKPEDSNSYSLGTIWQPVELGSLSITLDYFHIQQSNVIDANAQFFVTSNATTGEYGDRVFRDANGEIIRVISTMANLGEREVTGLDIGASWSLGLGEYGSIATNLSATHLMEYLSQSSPLSPAEDLAGTFEDDAADGQGTLPEWKTHLNIYWQHLHWEAAYSLNYVGSLTETIPGSELRRSITSWVTHDVQMSYQTLQGKARLTLGIDNLFDRAPPFAAAAFNDNFDARNYDATGRFGYAKITLKF
ncbi:TonB-dependent receptor [Porticoccaceae bacterium LTM1]|nr:TonB-dependent receptor [Porticoccaceae bacterium LTM1]